MKKILCVFLSLVMLLSVATVAFAAEEEEQRDLSEILAEKNIDEEFINAFNCSLDSGMKRESDSW